MYYVIPNTARRSDVFAAAWYILATWWQSKKQTVSEACTQASGTSGTAPGLSGCEPAIIRTGARHLRILPRERGATETAVWSTKHG